MRLYWTTAVAVCCLASIGVAVYANAKSIPSSIAATVLPALLLESALYLAMAFPAVGSRLDALSKWRKTGLLAASAIGPWLLLSGSANGLLLIALVVPVAAWYAMLPANRMTDLVLLLWLPAVVLMKGTLMRQIYPDAMPGVRVDFLGHLMWIRLSFGVMTLLRHAGRLEFGLLPSRSEIRAGVKWFLVGLPMAAAAGYGLGILRLGTPKAALWQLPLYAVGALIGVYCVVALSEEFFLRGLVFEWFRDVFGSAKHALAATTFVSAAVHLWFRSAFNWKFALCSAVLHYCFGRAYLEAQSVRAGMVAHALTVTAWLMVFGKSG
ncbi:MAG: hypothetical protein JNK48_11425 [Bryobacterales bacterium]|nr:hypothetical protein [Bryobacterales bacterium]